MNDEIQDTPLGQAIRDTLKLPGAQLDDSADDIEMWRPNTRISGAREYLVNKWFVEWTSQFKEAEFMRKSFRVGSINGTLRMSERHGWWVALEESDLVSSANLRALADILDKQNSAE